MKAKESYSKPIALILAQNFENYQGGSYHEDIIDAIRLHCDVRIYGPGYRDYDSDDTIEDVLRKIQLSSGDLSYIICSTSWDRPGQSKTETTVDIHPPINLSNTKGPIKIFYLNKEYINLPQKIAYSNRQKFDVVVTNAPKTFLKNWEPNFNAKVIYASFGVRASWLGADSIPGVRYYDFLFTGATHDKHLDVRSRVKESLFRVGTASHLLAMNWMLSKMSRSQQSTLFRNYPSIPANKGICRLLSIRNPVQSSLRVYWAERGPLSQSLLLRSLLPTGEEYRQLLAHSHTALCTRSAIGIIGPRYFELWSQGTIPVSFEEDKISLQIHGTNSIIIKHTGELEKKIHSAIQDNERMMRMRHNGRVIAENFTYDKILQRIFGEINA